ncbi:MAG: class I SAM-dependent methyltransferase [Bryobacteraceae bacterium]
MTQNESPGVADASPVLDLILAFRRSKTMFAAVELGIFDQLSGRSAPAEQLAEMLAVKSSALSRLLDGCVSLGLLARTADGYQNTAVADRFLVGQSPAALNGYIKFSNESLFKLWDRLEEAVREGTNRWTQVFGNRDALFDHYFRSDEKAANFLGGMHGFGQLSSPPAVRAFDLGRFTHLVDLGGATGHLAIVACEAYPNLRATVLDLPKVEKFARAYISRSSAADRIDFAGRDFFVDDLTSADLYSLGRIIHDWSDERTLPLLRKVFAALPSGGALLIQETILNADRSGPQPSLMQDLNMLVCTDGRERTFLEYRGLLESAGFSSVEYRLTGSLVDAILAVKS